MSCRANASECHRLGFGAFGESGTLGIYLCDYIREDEMWHIMQVAADTALEHFSSWEEYGRSFIMGRGVWHGDPTDSETAYEIVELLLKNGESPWKQSMWKE